MKAFRGVLGRVYGFGVQGLFESIGLCGVPLRDLYGA